MTTENSSSKGLEEVLGVIPEDQILVHGNSGPYLMNKSKWPKMSLDENKWVPNEKTNQDETAGCNLRTRTRLWILSYVSI